MKNDRRKKVENFLYEYIEKICHGDKRNVDLYKDLFKTMTDDKFDEFMKKIKNKEIHLQLIIPNGSGIKVTVKNNIEIAKSLGYNFFQRLNFEADGDLPAYTTPEKYLVLKLLMRRVSQVLSKKISVPTDNVSIDTSTGQVTGKSRARKLTFPEVQVLVGYGMTKTLNEMLDSRGGDLGQGRALDMMLYRTGKANQETIKQFGTGVRSTKTLKAYLLGMHINSTLKG